MAAIICLTISMPRRVAWQATGVAKDGWRVCYLMSEMWRSISLGRMACAFPAPARIRYLLRIGGRKSGLAGPRLEREFSRLFRLCSAPNLSPLDVPERPAGSAPRFQFPTLIHHAGTQRDTGDNLRSLQSCISPFTRISQAAGGGLCMPKITGRSQTPGSHTLTRLAHSGASTLLRTPRRARQCTNDAEPSRLTPT
jgi:hypothetical protein